MRLRSLRFLWLSCLLVLCSRVWAASGEVTLLKTPDGGIQPQAAVDSTCTVHLIYFKGDPKAGDLYYTRLKPGEKAWRPSIRVNSRAGSAIAVGTIRGGQIAIGQSNTIHVAWNSSDGSEMLYTHLNVEGNAFAPQRNLITWAGGLDGGGSLAADAEGRVYVAWHANPKKDGEVNRAVYLAVSRDNGQKFAPEKRINAQPTGVCGCCSLRTFVDNGGNVYVFYRAATKGVDRDMYLLTSRDRGETFASERVDVWNVNACPMSSSSMIQKGNTVLAAWETQGQVYYGVVYPAKETSVAPASAVRVSPRKHPVLAENKDRATLFAWTEGTGWNRGGALAWQVIDYQGKVTAQGRTDGVPVWGLLSAYTSPDGSFVLIY